MSAREAGARPQRTELGKAPAPRLLVVADEAIADLAELPPLVRGVIDRADEVYVVTPTLPGRLDWLASETNPARHAADERLDDLLDQLHAIGARAGGRIGDDDVVTAIADAVAAFAPDHILIALRASDHANWQEQGLIAQVRDRFDLPLTSFALDREGHIPRRSASDGRHARPGASLEPPERVALDPRREPARRSVERDGLLVLMLFLVSSVIMVAGVWFASEIDSMWALGPVVAVDFILLTAVTMGVYALLNDDTQSRRAAPSETPVRDESS